MACHGQHLGLFLFGALVAGIGKGSASLERFPWDWEWNLQSSVVRLYHPEVFLFSASVVGPRPSLQLFC